MEDGEIDLIVRDESRGTIEGPRIESVAVIGLLAGKEALRERSFKHVTASQVVVEHEAHIADDG